MATVRAAGRPVKLPTICTLQPIPEVEIMRPRAMTRKLDAHRAGFKCLGQDTENAFMNARGELQPLEQACHACLLALTANRKPQALVAAE